MIRSAAGKVMWVGRATVFMVGLAVILALVFGAATTAIGATGGNFLLGTSNVADRVSTLIKRGPGPALRLDVQEGQPPLKVDSSGKVADLNADQLDGKSEADFYAAGSKVADSAHADNAANAQNADKLDELDSTALLPGGDLPRGRTVRGSYDIRAYVPSQSVETDASAISFGYRLASSPTMRIIKAGAPQTAECPGTATLPEAAPGYLCVYETNAFNLNSDQPIGVNVTRDGASLQATDQNNGTGVTLPFWTYGTWAATGS